MFPNGLKLFLVEFSVDEVPYMSDPIAGDRQHVIVFAHDVQEAEAKVEQRYPSEENSIYRRVNFINTSEAIM